MFILAVCFRLPGLPWGIVHGNYFEPDELQHIGIAINFIHTISPSSVPKWAISKQWNARALGIQTGVFALAFSYLTGSPLSLKALVLTGRLLAIGYGAMLVVLLYIFGERVMGNRNAGIISALLLAGSDLVVTYSHYALPEVPDAFWLMFSVFFLFMYYQKGQNLTIRLCLGLGIGMALAFKFDPAPFLAFVILLLLQHKWKPEKKLADFAIISLVAILTLIISWASINITTYMDSFHQLWAQNVHTVMKNHHFLYNPILYLAAIIGGTSFPFFLVSIMGMYRCFSGKYGLGRGSFYIIIAAPFLLFLVYWSGDATFVRRAIPFIPLLALFAGLFIANLNHRKIVAVAIITYTFSLTAFSQDHFLNDPRYQAQRYLNRPEFKSQVTAYSPYSSAAVEDLPKVISIYNPLLRSINSYRHVGIVVLDETYYGRYEKYFTTPFRIPGNCSEVYHCNPIQMPIIQAIIAGKTPFVLLKRFDVQTRFPERILFKALFGSYDTFLGDVLIFGQPAYLRSSR